MLVLFNSQNDRIHTFKTYDALYSHLENREKIKQKPKGIFARPSWQRTIRNRKLAPCAVPFEEGLEQVLRQAVGTPGDGESASRPSGHPERQEDKMVRLINRDGMLIGRFDGESDLFSYIVGEAAKADDMGIWRLGVRLFSGAPGIFPPNHSKSVSLCKNLTE